MRLEEFEKKCAAAGDKMRVSHAKLAAIRRIQRISPLIQREFDMSEEIADQVVEFAVKKYLEKE